MTLDMDSLKRALEQELEVMQRRLQRLKADVSREHSSDSAEQAQERENDEVVDVIGTETQVAIQALQSALQRIEDGSYGECERCGEPIAVGRLQVMPQATLCIDCAS